MAVDRFGVTEDIPWLPADSIRLCPIHRLAFDDDPTHYHGAGRNCPAGGERLVGYLARYRESDGTPLLETDELWWE